MKFFPPHCESKTFVHCATALIGFAEKLEVGILVVFNTTGIIDVVCTVGITPGKH